MSVSPAYVSYADLGGAPWYVLVFLSDILSASVEMEVKGEKNVVVVEQLHKGTRRNRRQFVLHASSTLVSSLVLDLRQESFVALPKVGYTSSTQSFG